MTDVPAWIAAGVGLVALVVAYRAYRSQRGITRLEFAVITDTPLLPDEVAEDLEVRHNGIEVPEPSLTIVRLVNTGDTAIKPGDYESDIVVTLEGVAEIASATWTGSRPPDLRPAIEIDGGRVCLKPALINPEDMLELQVLAAGQADDITVAGRVAALKFVEREGLPYPPGSGPEGEMHGFDKFMWYVFQPVLLAAIGVGIASGENLSSTAQVLVLVATGIVVGILYPLRVRYLVRRRRLWRS